MNPWLWMNMREEKVNFKAKIFGVYHLYPHQEVPEEVPEGIIFLKEQGAVFKIR